MLYKMCKYFSQLKKCISFSSLAVRSQLSGETYIYIHYSPVLAVKHVCMKLHYKDKMTRGGTGFEG